MVPPNNRFVSLSQSLPYEFLDYRSIPTGTANRWQWRELISVPYVWPDKSIMRFNLFIISALFVPIITTLTVLLESIICIGVIAVIRVLYSLSGTQVVAFCYVEQLFAPDG